MNAGIILAWAAALLFGVPITLIFWAHIYLAVKDIFAAHAIATGTQGAETSETSAPSEGCQSGGAAASPESGLA